MYTDEKVDWEQLCKLEPELRTLYRRAKAIKDDGKAGWFCANRVWYGNAIEDGLKSTLLRLVGHSAAKKEKHPLLATSQAYDLAYETIYEVLPGCRNCSCADFSALTA
jgi:hypothetical protein